MEYIRGIREEGCFLCRIFDSSRDRENLLLKRGESCAVVLNRFPYNNGHLMVCPYRHVADIGDMTDEEQAETMKLASEAVSALRQAIRPDGFNVGLNLGRAGGAGLEEHVHTHVVPRWSGDTNFMPVLSDVKVIPQFLSELWDLLYPLLNPDPR